MLGQDPSNPFKIHTIYMLLPIDPYPNRIGDFFVSKISNKVNKKGKGIKQCIRERGNLRGSKGCVLKIRDKRKGDNEKGDK